MVIVHSKHYFIARTNHMNNYILRSSILIITILFGNGAYAAPSCSDLRWEVKEARESLNDWRSTMRSSQRNNAMLRGSVARTTGVDAFAGVDSYQDSVLQEREEKLADAQSEYDYYCR